MSHRFLFYTPALERGHVRVELADEEHHHLARVLRLRVADEIHVTNGRGLLATARLESVARARSEAAITRVLADEGAPRRFVLALALIRRDRFARAFEQCVELGITECVPLITAAGRRGRAERAFRERLERVAVAAMKQAFRCHRPLVQPVADVQALCARVGDFESAVVGDPEGPAPAACPGDTLVIVGPEGGLEPGELAALEGAGAARAAVSRHRLRAETAAVGLVAALARAD
ncbi:MAG: 16S rRNA (uracil(1498)-N(3))-methyltransferase [Candidatus Krumholzibacteria bacterium]|nr:16S rRNA (uracil(1498)-N(3))-methyltransferase [Candidatus Krumholzibacteria bacterium]